MGKIIQFVVKAKDRKQAYQFCLKRGITNPTFIREFRQTATFTAPVLHFDTIHEWYYEIDTAKAKPPLPFGSLMHYDVVEEDDI